MTRADISAVPSLPSEVNHDSYTYHSGVPASIQANLHTPVILGVDEAGRGPVLGPMVYGICYCAQSFQADLRQQSFADSKTLSFDQRAQLLANITAHPELGWATTIMSARDVSAGMLRPSHKATANLNEQAHDATIALIQLVLDCGVNITEIYVDTVGRPETYQRKLADRFPTVPRIVVAKKADSLYPIVSAASICAKVTRDASLDTFADPEQQAVADWGSGYPSDPRAGKWLTTYMDRVFGWSQIVRFSWQTAATLLEKGVVVRWPDDYIVDLQKAKRTFTAALGPGQQNSKNNPQKIATDWFGYHQVPF